MPTAAGIPEIITRYATGDMRAYLYHLVRGSGNDDGKVVLAGSAGLGGLGVLHTLRMGRDGESAGVGVHGPSKVIAGAAIGMDVAITNNVSGRAVAATSGQVVIGYTTSVASAAGDYIEAYLVRDRRTA